MRKYSFIINDRQYNVDVLDVSETYAKVEVNGILYNVLLQKEHKETKTQTIKKSEFVMDATTKARTTDHPAQVEMKQPGNIQSPLPGLIKKILVKNGDEVKAGQVVLIMEAMKMENEIQSTVSGKVNEIAVKEGDSVLEGDTLLKVR
ncbi:biotin/lipoyl-binding protein [candidate division WOR-3 bacterium]|nr:biotin/lipoyl-binding protein [candidate division WOR-3 bacterium]